MQPAVQVGGPPPPLNGHDASKQTVVKTADAEHHGKNKKRERSNHHVSESSVKVEDATGESKRSRREKNGTISNHRIEEMSNMVDKNGGLYSFIGVDRLYSLMQHKDQSDMSAKQAHNLCLYRAGLVGTIVATDRDDCLNRFVQIGGLNLLNEWLTEAHKGRLLGEGGNSSSKDLEKIVDDLLLIILKSLEKLPVDLQILRACNAGRSVKSLRSHKNPDVQKKAKKLVDVWKKKISDPKMSNGLHSKSGSMTNDSSSHVMRSADGSSRNTLGSSKAVENQTAKVPSSSPSRSSLRENQSGSNSPNDMHTSSSVPDERSSNIQQQQIWSNGTSKSNIGQFSSKARSPAPSKTPNGKEFGTTLKPRNSRVVSSSSSASEKLPVEQIKRDSSPPSNEKLIIRIPNPVKAPVSPNPDLPKDNSASLLHESLEFKTWSSSVSCVDDSRTSTKNRVKIEDAEKAGNAEADLHQYKGEGDCQSSESQLSFSSAQCPSEQPKNGNSRSVHKGRRTQEGQRKYNKVLANNIEDETGISLLACIAADESSRSEKDAVESRMKHSKDPVEVLPAREKENNVLQDSTLPKSLPSAPDFPNLETKPKLEAKHNEPKLEDDNSNQSKQALSINHQEIPSTIKLTEQRTVEEEPSKGQEDILDAKKETSKTDEEFRFPGEDALEVAVQVAKEVEQEMETYDKDNVEAKEDSQKENSVLPKKEEEADVAISKKASTSSEAHQTPPSTSPIQDASTPQNSGHNSKVASPEQNQDNASCMETEASEKHDFDLNEGVNLEENTQETTSGFSYPVTPIPVTLVASQPSMPSAPIAVMASAKGAFVSLPSPPRGKGEQGWRGSAATSAFRPAEPRRTPERSHNLPETTQEVSGEKGIKQEKYSEVVHVGDETGAGSSGRSQPFLDFDLNVADEEPPQDQGEPVGNNSSNSVSNGTAVKFNLDLNLSDEQEDNATKTSAAMISSNGRHDLSNGSKQVKHDFDLNDGLNIDDQPNAEESTSFQGGMRSISNHDQNMGFKMQNEIANMGTWSHAGSPISAVAMSAFASSLRPENPFPVAMPQAYFSMGQGQAMPPFHADMYRSPHGFSSPSPAAFSYPTQHAVFPYTSFPFGFGSSTYPAASGSFLDATGSHTFAPANSQMLASGTMLPPHLRPPYMMGLGKMPPANNNDRMWSKPSLDLNAGPDIVDAENREDRLGPRFQQVSDSPWLGDRHASVSSESLKRKEPDGGWEFNRFGGIKQESRR